MVAKSASAKAAPLEAGGAGAGVWRLASGPRTNKPTLCLDKIRKCRSADWKGIESENAENADA